MRYMNFFVRIVLLEWICIAYPHNMNYKAIFFWLAYHFHCIGIDSTNCVRNVMHRHSLSISRSNTAAHEQVNWECKRSPCIRRIMLSMFLLKCRKRFRRNLPRWQKLGVSAVQRSERIKMKKVSITMRSKHISVMQLRLQNCSLGKYCLPSNGHSRNENKMARVKPKRCTSECC